MESITQIPYKNRIAFADSNWVSFSIPASARQIDVVFEDASGKSVFGSIAPGYSLLGAPLATDPKCASWSWSDARLGNRVRYLSVALAAGHYCSLVVL